MSRHRSKKETLQLFKHFTWRHGRSHTFHVSNTNGVINESERRKRENEKKENQLRTRTSLCHLKQKKGGGGRGGKKKESGKAKNSKTKKKDTRQREQQISTKYTKKLVMKSRLNDERQGEAKPGEKKDERAKTKKKKKKKKKNADTDTDIHTYTKKHFKHFTNRCDTPVQQEKRKGNKTKKHRHI